MSIKTIDKHTTRVTRALAILALLAGSSLRAQDNPGEKKSLPQSAGPEGFGLQSESGDFRLQLRGYVQFDGRFYTGDEGALATDTFLLRRVRPILQGSLGRYFDFNLTPDFGGGTAVLQDAWIEFKPSPKLRVRLGKQKPPVGLERLQSATAIHFVERAFPSLLSPSRDVGIQVHGELAGGVVAYGAAFLNGAPDGGSIDNDLNDSKDLAGRLFFSPFKKGKSSLQGLGLGIAGTTGRQSGPLPAYRSAGQISVITILTGITADGTRKRYTPQLSFYSGRVGFLAEYAQSTSRVKKADGQRFDLEAKAWQATATLALTDDRASYSGVRPKRAFDPAKGQWGALELVARIHGLELSRESVEAGLIDPTRSARELSAWAVGLNWSLTRNIKQVVDFERVSFKGGSSAGDRESENLFVVRTQVGF